MQNTRVRSRSGSSSVNYFEEVFEGNLLHVGQVVLEGQSSKVEPKLKYNDVQALAMVRSAFETLSAELFTKEAPNASVLEVVKSNREDRLAVAEKRNIDPAHIKARQIASVLSRINVIKENTLYSSVPKHITDEFEKAIISRAARFANGMLGHEAEDIAHSLKKLIEQVKVEGLEPVQAINNFIEDSNLKQISDQKLAGHVYSLSNSLKGYLDIAKTDLVIGRAA